MDCALAAMDGNADAAGWDGADGLAATGGGVGGNGALATTDGGCSGAAGGIGITSGLPHAVQK